MEHGRRRRQWAMRIVASALVAAVTAIVPLAGPAIADPAPVVFIDQAKTVAGYNNSPAPGTYWVDQTGYTAGDTVTVSTTLNCGPSGFYNWFVFTLLPYGYPYGVSVYEIPGASQVTSGPSLQLKMPTLAELPAEYQPYLLRVDVDPWCVGSAGPAQQLYGNDFLGIADTTDTTTTPPGKPTANLTKAPVAGDPFSWGFSAAGSTGASSYSWDFNDGGPAGSGQDVQHRYKTAGTYTVTLTAAGPGGTATATTEVKVPSTEVTVNTTDDDPLSSTATNHRCDTGKLVAGGAAACSLRAAIEVVDAGGGAAINFAIAGAGPHVISPTSALPALSTAATVDGTSQPTGSIELDGAGAGPGADGLTVTGGGATIKGLSVVGFLGAAVHLTGGTGSTIVGNLLGVHPDGSVAAATDGVFVDGSSANTVGGSGADRNVIVATSVAVLVSGKTGPAGSNQVTGNHIGTDAAGSAALAGSGNGFAGVVVLAGSGASAAAAVSGNTVNAVGTGIAVAGAGAAGSSITGNRIGTDASGTAAIAGGAAAATGIRVDGASGVTISGNVVSGPQWGIAVAGSPQLGSTGGGVSFLPPSRSATAGSGGIGAGFSGTVAGNDVGVLADGVTRAGPATGEGIVVWAGADAVTVSDNTVGASSAGIEVWGGSGHVVTANRVGVGADGTTVFGFNGGPGIEVAGTTGATVGGSGTNDGNVVGAAQHGIEVDTLHSVAATDTTLQANLIGTTSTGTPAPNNIGVEIIGAKRTTLTANTVANSTSIGISIDGAASATTLTRNRIGITPLGDHAAGNATGVQIGTATDTTVGTGNTISASTANGLISAGSHTRISGSRFGVGATTDAHLGNGGSALVITGGDADIEGNTIAHSGQDGIAVAAKATAKILHNSITDDHLGIDAPAPAPAAPTLRGAVRVTRGTSVRTWLVLTGLPAGADTVEVFANPSCADPEGKTPLVTKQIVGPRAVVTIAGQASLTAFTATVTDLGGHTSSFSTCALPDTAAPDIDGDGIPDLVEAAGPVDASGDPTVATFPDDNSDWITIKTDHGTLHEVGPVDVPAGAPAGLPVGLYTFHVTGLDPGTADAVHVALPTSVSSGGDYWKYGPTTAGAAPTWYRFTSDGSGTGAVAANAVQSDGTISPGFTLLLRDGGRGDDDGAADGSIVDPSGPADSAPPASTTTTTTPTTTSSSTPTPSSASAPATATPVGTTLPVTGTDVSSLLLMGIALIVVGAWAAARAGRMRRRDGADPTG